MDASCPLIERSWPNYVGGSRASRKVNQPSEEVLEEELGGFS